MWLQTVHQLHTCAHLHMLLLLHSCVACWLACPAGILQQVAALSHLLLTHAQLSAQVPHGRSLWASQEASPASFGFGPPPPGGLPVMCCRAAAPMRKSSPGECLLPPPSSAFEQPHRIEILHVLGCETVPSSPPK